MRGVEVLDRTGPPEFAWLGQGVAGVVDLGGRVANTWRGEWTAMAIRPGWPRTLLLAERDGGIRSIPEPKRAGDSLPGKELLHVGEPVPMLPPNPRSMKRFVNDYTMARAVRLLESDPVPVDALARWTVLRQRWPVLAAHLAEHPDAVDGDPAHRPDGLTEELAALFGGADVRRVLADGALSADLVRRCRGG